MASLPIETRCPRREDSRAGKIDEREVLWLVEVSLDLGMIFGTTGDSIRIMHLSYTDSSQ